MAHQFLERVSATCQDRNWNDYIGRRRRAAAWNQFHGNRLRGSGRIVRREFVDDRRAIRGRVLRRFYGLCLLRLDQYFCDCGHDFPLIKSRSRC